MAAKATPDEDKRPKQPDDKSKGDPTGLNKPELDDSGKVTVRAVSDSKQAWEICKGLRDNGKKFRVKRNAVIMDKYNGSSPFDNAALKRANQTWRNNFSTQFLASIIDRIRPQFQDALKRIKTLCNASLPVNYPDATEKAAKFNGHITDTIRSWMGWTDFLNLLTQEDVVIGYATPIWLDKSDIEWRPKIYRSDEAFFPDGTGQYSKEVPCFMVEEEKLIHEFIQPLQNKKAAEAAGYNFPNCVKLVNKDQSAREHNELEREDAIREGRYEDSFKTEAKRVRLYHLIVQEYDGGVDLWTVDADTGDEVRYVKELHEDMGDATVLFTLQTGNNKLYGSKGIGRLLVNIHIAVERGRCLGADQMYLSGLLVCSAPEKDLNKIFPVVRHPFVFVPDSVEIASQTIQFQSEMFLAMDTKLVEIAESIAGSFIPPQIEQGTTPNTKIEAAAKVERQEKVKQGVLGRFFTQVNELIQVMKRKICSAVNVREAMRVHKDRENKRKGAAVVVAASVMKWLERVFSKQKREMQAVAAYESKIADREAVECIVAMLEDGLTVEEIGMLRESTETENLQDIGPEQDQNTLTFIQNNIENPLMNKVEATKMAGEIMLPSDRAKRLIIDDEVDQTIEAEGIRMQILELGEMVDGNAIPVSPRDNHKVHRQALLPHLDTLMKSVSQAATATPQLVTAAKLAAGHYQQHLELDTETDPEAVKEEGKALATINQQLAEAEGNMVKMAQEAMTPNPEQMPVPVAGGPMGAGPTGQIQETPEDKDREMEAHKATADIALRAREADQRDRELTLKETEHGHREQMDVIKAQTEAAKTLKELKEPDEPPAAPAAKP